MKFCQLIAPILAVVLLAPCAAAQEMPTAEMREGANYYIVTYTKFKPGMADEARELIYNHFWPVDKTIGREVIPFDNLTGEWDHVVYFPLEDGPGELAWEMSPTNEEWMTAFIEQEGGTASAEEIQRRFSELVEESRTELVMTSWSALVD